MTHELIGYHGTEYSNRQKIINNGFLFNRRDDHWLGQGIYFYDNFELAKWWVSKKTYCTVFKVKIQVDSIFFLDLDTKAGMDYFLKEVQAILDGLNFGVTLTEDNKYKNLCFVLDLLKVKKEIKVVAYTFLKERPKYAEQDIKEFKENYFALPYGFGYKEKQICATDNSVIIEKECFYTNHIPKWN